jgi:hypothetical protein
MPPRAIVPVVAPSPSLPDIPIQYLIEKGQWTDFKRSIENCGLTWNLPDWLYTIAYKGMDYKAIKDSGEKIDDLFPPPAVMVAEQKIEVGDTSRKWLKLLGMPKMGNNQSYSQKFCNLNTLQFEPDSKLPARQKLWSWFVKCLQGEKSTPGPFYYLVNQVPVYDISHLYKRLVQVMDIVTICSLDDEVYNVTHLDFEPKRHDLFGYVEELRVAMTRLDDVNSKLPENGRVILSETYLRSRIIRAARQIPSYKIVIDNLVTLPVEEWSALKIEALLQKFESARSNLEGMCLQVPLQFLILPLTTQ